MGLGSFKKDDYNSHEKKAFGYHPRNEELQELVDELQSRFPEKVQVDFIEVSTKMTKTWAKAYRSSGTQYIRVAEHFIEEYGDDKDMVKRAVLHEMVHLWFYQNGYGDISDNDALFNWALGMVGADISGYGPNHLEWRDIIAPLLNHNSQ